MTSARLLLAACLLASIVSSCSSSSDSAEPAFTFDDAVEEGQSCRELYRALNAVPPDWSGRDAANEQLFQIGCTDPDADRASTTTVPAGDPSAKCIDSMQSMEAAYNTATETEFSALSEASLVVCGDAPSWLTAAREAPGAIGLVSGAYVKVDDLVARCYLHATTPVCVDATERGWT